jgi:hypothetical protein
VDHEIHYDIDIQRSRREHAKPVNLKKKRLMHEGSYGQYCGVKSLEMADLKNAVMFAREIDQGVRVLKRPGNGFFDQSVNPGSEQLGRDGGMLEGGYHNRGGAHLGFGEQEIFNGRIDRNLEFLPERFRYGLVWIDDRCQFDWSVSLLKLAPNTDMVAAECTCSYNGYAGWRQRRQTGSTTYLQLRGDSGNKGQEAAVPDRRTSEGWLQQTLPMARQDAQLPQ